MDYKVKGYQQFQGEFLRVDIKVSQKLLDLMSDTDQILLRSMCSKFETEVFNVMRHYACIAEENEEINALPPLRCERAKYDDDLDFGYDPLPTDPYDMFPENEETREEPNEETREEIDFDEPNEETREETQSIIDKGTTKRNIK